MDIEKINMVTDETVNLLRCEEHREWVERYATYADEILKNSKKIEKLKKKFREWKPLFIYMNLGMAMHSPNSFQLRFRGHEVARLKVDLKNENERDAVDEVKISSVKTFSEFELQEIKNESWLDDPAVKFRNHFKELDNKHDFQLPEHEHQYESMMLTELEKSDRKRKFQGTFSEMRPVKIAGVGRFQLRTPIAASKAGKTIYKASGGGIDILARIGRGGGTALSVIELKRPSIRDTQKTMEQGVAYTTFIRELLRGKSGQDWYRVFGFKRTLPARLKLNCVVAMGDQNKPFEPQVIRIEEDEIHLHYLYYKESNGGISVTETSLPRN